MTLTRATWTRRTWCCWTHGRRWEVKWQHSKKGFQLFGVTRRIRFCVFVLKNIQIILYVFPHTDFLVGWKVRQQDGDQASSAPRPRVSEDAAIRPRPGHACHLCQAGLRTAHLHRLVQQLGTSQVERASSDWALKAQWASEVIVAAEISHDCWTDFLPCLQIKLSLRSHWFGIIWSPQQERNSYEEMIKTLSDAAAISQITNVSTHH